jgi:hypothetical protein
MASAWESVWERLQDVWMDLRDIVKIERNRLTIPKRKTLACLGCGHKGPFLADFQAMCLSCPRCNSEHEWWGQ